MALTLALITLATLVLNAGLAWLLVRQVQHDDRIAVAEQLASYLAAALENEASQHPAEPRYGQVLSGFRDPELDILELYVTDVSMSPLTTVRGKPPRTLDAGFREAFFGRQPHLAVRGRFSSSAHVEVTWPVAPVGPVIAALRLAMPLQGSSLLESQSGFLLGYTLFTGIIITLAGYVLLRRRLVVPVQILRAGTARIAAGDFEHRVSIDAAAELVALTDSLNDLARSLGGYRARTHEQVRSLEEANQALALAQKSLIRSAKLASVGQLAAGIAHEVGNPLAAVMGYVDLLQQERADSALSADLVQRCARELERIHDIISELLDFARPSANSAALAQAEEVLQGALETLRFQPLFRDVQVVLRLEEDLPAVAIESDKLHQVAVNLLLNAVDAMEGRGEVRIEASHREDGVRIVVRDQGPGFGLEVEAQLFEPFFSSKPPGKGMGLGLATSQAIIEGCGGSIRAANHPEGGAVFTIELPLA